MATQLNETSRREFLKTASMILGAGALAGSSMAVFGCGRSAGPESTVWRLNPAFHLNEISPRTVEITTRLGSGDTLRHRFEDLEADLFRFAASGQVMAFHIDYLAKKYGMTPGACRDSLNSSLKEFAEARLIYAGSPMKVKVVEVKNG